MPSIDIDEDTSVETTTMTETPTLDLNAKVEIINFINTFDVKGNCYLYHEGEEKLVSTLLRPDDRKRISLMKELEEARTIRQLHKTRLFKDHPFLKNKSGLFCYRILQFQKAICKRVTIPRERLIEQKSSTPFGKASSNCIMMLRKHRFWFAHF